jgi:hypothetical protein
MKKKSYLYAIIIIVFLFGCQDTQTEQRAIEKVEPKAGRIIVFGIDETGSYKLWTQIKKTAIKIIQQLEPGDIFYFRRITDASYLDTCTIFRLELPLIEKSENANPFDRKTKKVRGAQVGRITSLKYEACQRLSAVQFTNARHTDIYGFLAASSDRFRLAPKDFRRILIIASDLKDNVGYKVKLDLSGVVVAVIGFQTSKDPAKTQILKQYWIEKLTHAGATRVIFLSVEEEFSTTLFKE